MVVQALVLRNIPGVATATEQDCFVCMNGHGSDTAFVSHLLRSQTPGKGAQHPELRTCHLAGHFSAARVLLRVYARPLLLLNAAKGLIGMGNVGAQREEGTLNQPGTRSRLDVHYPAFVYLFAQRVRCVQMPDLVVAIEVERGHGDCQQRHQAATAAYREVNAISLPFELAQQAM